MSKRKTPRTRLPRGTVVVEVGPGGARSWPKPGQVMNWSRGKRRGRCVVGDDGVLREVKAGEK